MRILVACEESQTVCIAFRNKGHEAFSCDIQPCSGGHPEWHIQGDAIEEAYGGGYDMMIGHPPCTYISFAGTHCWNDLGRCEKRLQALEFFRKLWEAPIDKICLENPKSCASPVIAKYTQEIQPYYFGESNLKTTWLWLKNLPLLQHYAKDTLFNEKTHTDKPEPEYISQNGKKLYFTEAKSGSNNGGHIRSKTFAAFANAMAEQWG
jgi:hypothetical protein